MRYKNTNRVAEKVASDLEKEIKKSLDKNDTGGLHKSIKVSTTIDAKGNTKFSLEMQEYGKWVDEGRKPGKGMPVKPLQDWIKRKKMTVKDANGKSTKVTDANIGGLSYIINRKIREEGIKPTHFIENAVNKYILSLETKIADAYGDDIIDGITL